jgi:uncharacterized RDD family membrane protein YckC
MIGQTQGQASAGVVPAAWGKRLLAYIVDFLIIAIPYIGISAGVTSSIHSETIKAFVQGIFAAVIWAAYARITMDRKGQHHGQTFGMQLLGIRVVKADNSPVDTKAILMRQGLGIGFLGTGVLNTIATLGTLGLIVSFIILIAWFIACPVIDEQNRCPHDMLAGTRPLGEQ